MTHDELLAKIDEYVQLKYSPDKTMAVANWTEPANALRAVVEYLKDWARWEKIWERDVPMTYPQEARRIERLKLIKDLTDIIEKELK